MCQMFDEVSHRGSEFASMSCQRDVSMSMSCHMSFRLPSRSPRSCDSGVNGERYNRMQFRGSVPGQLVRSINVGRLVH